MKCKYCKQNIEDDSIFCRFCGEKQARARKKKQELSVPAPKLLPSGTYFNRVMVNGKRVSVSACSEAEYYAKSRALKAGLIQTTTPNSTTLKQAIRRYIDDRDGVASPASIRGWEIIYKNRFKGYMDKRIDDINYQRMIADEAKKYAPKTVANSWGLASAALKQYKLKPEVTLPQQKKPDGDFLDYEQIQSFLSSIRGDAAELAAILALHSLRQSELLDVDVTDIVNGYINVSGAVVQDKDNNYVSKDTNKNQSSTRSVPVLIPRLYELLPEEGKLVTLYPTIIRRHIVKACRRADLPPVSLHDLRRSFASLAYHLGWKDRTTMTVGGWSDMTTLKAVYEKLSEKDKQEDIDKMRKYYQNWQ